MPQRSAASTKLRSISYPDPPGRALDLFLDSADLKAENAASVSGILDRRVPHFAPAADPQLLSPGYQPEAD